VGVCQAGQGSGGSPIGELQQLEDFKKNVKTTRVYQDLHIHD